MVPARPTIQQTLSEGAEPAVRSANTLLICRDQEAPPSVENSIMPVWPARHNVFLSGVAITDGLMAAAIRKSALSLKAAAGAGAAGGAAARWCAGDSDLVFLDNSLCFEGFGPEISCWLNWLCWA